MDRKDNKVQEDYTIDITHILKSLWKNAWVIVVAGILAAAIGFAIAAFLISPTYSSSVKLYVNNKDFSIADVSIGITQSDITASQKLVKTYGEILNSRTTLKKVIEVAGVDYTWKELAEHIKYGSSNDTEIMYVTVTTEDPYEASRIANAIADVLSTRVSDIIDGATMAIVDDAVPDNQKVAPSITNYTAIGLMIGVLIAVLVLVVIALFDDTIHDEDYVIRTYGYPVLAKIPDLTNSGSGKHYGYYYYSHYGNNSDADK